MKKTTMISRAVCALLAVLLLALPLSAAVLTAGADTVSSAETEKAAGLFDPFAEGASYSSVLYNNTNGLPTSEANAITQTSDGFIWIGSYGGLVRYDGVRFERMDSSLGVSGVVSLFADSRDRLWLGSNDSGLAMIYRGDLIHWGFEEGLRSLFINCITEDENGIIYVGTKDGMFLIGEDMKPIPLDDSRVSGSNIIDVKKGCDGLMYCLSKEKNMFTVKDGRIASWFDCDSIPASDIRCMLPDMYAPGYVYFGTEDGIFYCDMRDVPKVVKTVTDESLTMLESLTYINGRVWACSDNCVVTLFEDEVRVLEGIPMSNKVNHVIQDYEGNLWLSSTRQGVLKITPNCFTDIYYRYDIPQAVVNSTCVYDGKLFVGTDIGLTVIGDDGVLDSLPLKEAFTLDGQTYTDLISMLKDGRIRSLIKDSRDRLWISTWRDFGLLCYDHGKVTGYGEYNGLISDTTRTVTEKKDGSIVAATNHGISVLKDGRVTASYGRDEGIENPVILTVAENSNGEIIAGSDGGGIYIIGESGVTAMRIKDGLTSDTILRLKRDRTRDIIWIFTSNSVSYMTPDHKITVIKDFPYTNNFDFVQNSRDEMWILSSNGIYVVPTEEMLENGSVDPAHYSIANGLPCTATANSYSGIDDSGELYLSGNTGVVKMNTESDFGRSVNFKASVPYVRADDELIFPDEEGAFTIAAGTKTLTISAFVFDYSLMTPQVSYCMEGFDDRYTTVDYGELTPVVYTNLRGRDYRFVMKVTDLRTKSEKTVTVSITKEKAFYERIWFYVLLAVAFVLLLLFGLRAFYREKIRRMQKKHQEEVERERILTELNTAGKIQQGMLPRDFPERPEFDLFASMTPAREVGGDFYDFFMVDDDHLCMVIADVSGKGIPAALFMMAAMIVIRNYAKLGKSPAEVLTMANGQISEYNEKSLFVTVWLGVLEVSTGRLTAANAGHEYPMLMQPGGSFELFKDKHGLVLGFMEGLRYKEYELNLKPGSKLFLYTDGVPEAANSGRELFGTERMLAALNGCPGSQPKDILQAMHVAVEGFVKDAEQFDDQTMLCLEYRGKAEEEKE